MTEHGPVPEANAALADAPSLDGDEAVNQKPDSLRVQLSPNWSMIYGETFAVLPVTHRVLEVAILANSPVVTHQRFSESDGNTVKADGLRISGQIVETGRIRLEADAANDLAFNLLLQLLEAGHCSKRDLASRVAQFIENTKLYEVDLSESSEIASGVAR